MSRADGSPVDFQLQFRRYALPFRGTVRTAHGRWERREGLILRLESADGRVGYGEAAPIPGFGTETTDLDEVAARRLGDRVTERTAEEVPDELGCLRFALGAALKAGANNERGRAGGPSRPSAVERYLPVAALLPAGQAARAELERRAEAGFRVFKWKVGVDELDRELGLLDDLCGALPGGARLRLDANGAWDRRQAERWLERCAERPIEFVEQPALAEPGAGVELRQRVEDLLLGLAEDYPTPIALDESLAGGDDIARWVGRGWPGIFVVKPSLLGDASAARERLGRCLDRVVFSSALETAVGARAALQAAFDWTSTAKTPRALGFGVWPLFADARCDGPHAAPFIHERDLAALDAEATWNALS